MLTIRLLPFATDPAGAPADRAAAAVSGPPWAPTPAPNRAALGQAGARSRWHRPLHRQVSGGGRNGAGSPHADARRDGEPPRRTRPRWARPGGPPNARQKGRICPRPLRHSLRTRAPICTTRWRGSWPTPRSGCIRPIRIWEVRVRSRSLGRRRSSGCAICSAPSSMGCCYESGGLWGPAPAPNDRPLSARRRTRRGATS